MRREVCEDILLLICATNDHHNGLAKMVNGNEERRFVDSRFRYHLHQILIIQLEEKYPISTQCMFVRTQLSYEIIAYF